MLSLSDVHTFYGNIEALRGVDIEGFSKLLEKDMGYGKETQNDFTKQKSVYVPHLTIFRINRHFKGRISFDPVFRFDPFTDEICQIKLKRSMLTADGPIYSDLFTIDARA